MNIYDHQLSFIANREALILKGYVEVINDDKAMRLTKKGYEAAKAKLKVLPDEDVLLFIVYINTLNNEVKREFGL